MSIKKILRKLTNDIHLWLGIISGLVLFIVCLTGTIYTFHNEVDEIMNKEKYVIATPSQVQPIHIDKLVQQLQESKNSKVTRIEIPQDPQRSYKVTLAANNSKSKSISSNIEKKGEGVKAQKGKGNDGKTYFVNPYNASIIGDDKSKTADFFMIIMKLHRWLLVEGVGKVIVGIATIIFTILCISGLVLWFPKKIKHIKQGLKIKTSGNFKRLNHDLHNVLGFYALPFLLIMSLTGPCWSFEWYRNGVSSALNTEVFKGRKEKPVPSKVQENTNRIPISEALATANSNLSTKGDIRVSFPKGEDGSYVITKTKSGAFTFVTTDKIQIDQYTNTVLKIDRFSDKPFNEKISSNIRAFHLGDFMGMFSKIIWFITCLIATSLPITGTIIWLNKMKKPLISKKKPILIVPSA